MENYFDAYQKHPIFSDDFFGQFLRTLGKTYTRCADVGECYTALSHIRDCDFESWYTAWFQLAKEIEELASQSYQAGHLISAGKTYLRAAEYYRASEFFLREKMSDPRILGCFDRLRFCFERALEGLHPDASKIRIPYDETTLDGYLFPAPDRKNAKATLVMPSGYDGTVEELYILVPAALENNYSILIFDGPGQGHALRRQNLFMRPDFNHVISQLLDWAESFPLLKGSKFVLIGRSFGGFLAPQAACGETRLSGLVCDPGQIDLADALKKLLPLPILQALEQEKSEEVNKFFEDLFSKNKMKAFFFRSRMNVHGVTTPYDYLKEMLKYTFTNKAQTIICPTLVCDNPSDKISTRGNALYEALTCKKTYVKFEGRLGAGMHCEADGSGQFERVLFDWLDDLST